MKKTKASQGALYRNKFRRISVLLALAIGLSSHSWSRVPSAPVSMAVIELQDFARDLSTALRQLGTPHRPSRDAPIAEGPISEGPFSEGPPTSIGDEAEPFAACPQFFVNARSPLLTPKTTNRALCYDAFAVLHSGESKTPVFVAEKLNRESVADADETRTNKFFPDARLRASERATLEDYKGNGFDRGHMAPAGDMPTAQAMAQSFSLANMVPQAPELNRGVWAKSVEAATRKYAAKATGDVYVITGPVFVPSIAQSPGIGPGHVRVPKYLFKLVYDERKNRAWAHWLVNDDSARGSKPISYAELVARTGINFLPTVTPGE